MIERGYIAESQSTGNNSNQTESIRNPDKTLPSIIKMEVVPTANEIPASSAPPPPSPPENVAKKPLHQLRIQLPALQLTQGTSYHQTQQQQQHHSMIIQQQSSSSHPSSHQIIQTTNQQQLQQLVQHNINNASGDQMRSPNSVTVVVIKTMLPDQ